MFKLLLKKKALMTPSYSKLACFKNSVQIQFQQPVQQRHQLYSGQMPQLFQTAPSQRNFSTSSPPPSNNRDDENKITHDLPLANTSNTNQEPQNSSSSLQRAETLNLAKKRVEDLFEDPRSNQYMQIQRLKQKDGWISLDVINEITNIKSFKLSNEDLYLALLESQKIDVHDNAMVPRIRKNAKYIAQQEEEARKQQQPQNEMDSKDQTDHDIQQINQELRMKQKLLNNFHSKFQDKQKAAAKDQQQQEQAVTKDRSKQGGTNVSKDKNRQEPTGNRSAGTNEQGLNIDGFHKADNDYTGKYSKRKIKEIQSAIKEVETKYAQKSQQTRALIFKKRQSEEQNQMQRDEHYLMGGNGGSRDFNESFGPTRSLKQAPKFSFMNTNAAWEESPAALAATEAELMSANADGQTPAPGQAIDSLEALFALKTREQEEAEKLGSKKQAAAEASKSGGMFSRFLNSLGSSKDSSSSIQRPPPRVKDPEFFEMIDAKRKLAKAVLNPDKKYTELREQQTLAPEYGQNVSEMLSLAAQNIASLGRENKKHVIETLKSIDGRGSERYWSSVDCKTLAQVAHLSLSTQTSMPQLLDQISSNPNFLSKNMLETNEIDNVASCTVSLLKMAQQDYHLAKTDKSEFEKRVAGIQSKIENIHNLLLTQAGQRSASFSKVIDNQEPSELFNRLVLFPNPQQGGRLQKHLGALVKALVKADMSTENWMKGLFTQAQRNYILARGMQVKNDKDLQNDLRILAQSDKNVFMHNTAQESLNSCYIVSGMIKKDNELNNVHHMVGLLPPTVQPETHSIDQIVTSSRIDYTQVSSMRFFLNRQFYTCNTLPQFRLLLDTMEFTQKYAPVSIFKANQQFSRLVQSILLQSSKFKFSLNDLIRLNNVMLTSMVQPGVLFNEILSHEESLATAVDKRVLKIFIDDILARILQHQVVFDHLTNSTSKIHSEFMPYTRETFHVLSKLVSDLVSEGNEKIPAENFALLNKILSTEMVTTKVFDSPEKAISVLGRFLDEQLEQLKGPRSERSLKSTQLQIEHLQTYDAIFKALRSVKPLVKSEPEILEKIATSAQVAIDNLLKDLNQFSADSSLEQEPAQHYSTGELFPLHELIETNKSILDAIASLDGHHSSRVMQNYLDQTPISNIIDRILGQHFQEAAAPSDEERLDGGKDFFQSPAANKLINRAIEQATWDKIERMAGPLVSYFNQVLDADVLQQDRKLDFIKQAESFTLKIRNSRSLYGVDLARFYKLIRQLQEANGAAPGLFDEIIMNVSCNLRTLGVNLLLQMEKDSSEMSIDTDNQFKGENEERIEKEKQYKRMIFEMYKEVFSRNPDLFVVGTSYTLSPLSVIFAELYDEMSFEDRILCLKMLGSDSIDRYTEEFIKKLYDNYSQQHQIEAIINEDIEKFISLAEHWPKFLQNNVLLHKLSTIDTTHYSIHDQSRMLKIQTHKNLINPQFIKNHFQQFIVLTDKAEVEQYLTNFLKSIAYVGFTDDINMSLMTQVLRRIYKEPKNVETDDLLNFLVTMAISNARYSDFDVKSREFVEKSIELIEQQFTGTTQIKVDVGDKTFELYTFNQIPSTQKSYNKILDRNAPDFESDLAREGKKEYFKQAGETQEQSVRWRPTNEEEMPEEDLAAFTKEVDLEAIEDADEDELQDDQDKKAKRVYDRGAADMNSSFDEQHYFKQRNYKMTQLAKADNHLLLYSNVNILDFVDINMSNVAKAWTVLFHFKGKSVESMLYEEFNSIAQRNTISKTKNHEVFNKVYLRLNTHCFHSNMKIQLAGACEETGWPIDISLSQFDSFRLRSGPAKDQEQNAAVAASSQFNKQQQFAVYFLLQEEICYNSQTRREEPLGLQKLMLRHLQQISNYKVCTIDENMAALDVDSAIARIQEEFSPVLGTNYSKSSGRRGKDKGYGYGYEGPILAKMSLSQKNSGASLSELRDDFHGNDQPFNINDQEDFQTVSEDEELDDIVDVPQNTL